MLKTQEKKRHIKYLLSFVNFFNSTSNISKSKYCLVIENMPPNFKKFAKFYNRVVLFISFFSLVIFLIMLFAGKTQFFSSTFVSRNDAYYRSLLGLYFRIDVGSPRNYGPFWEPGIFSLVILTAVVFEIVFSKKVNIVNIIVKTIKNSIAAAVKFANPWNISLLFIGIKQSLSLK